MPLNIWTQPSGFRFTTIQENSFVDQQLPVNYANGFNDSSLLTFSVISGKLPDGLRIKDSRIFGSAREVSRTTDHKFVIRAKLGNDISDRTFYLKVEGSDDPIWQTPGGSLAILNNNQYYVLDSTYIDFQLEAIDNDTAAGQVLKYTRVKGELPPGLILTESGRIVGFIQPALTLPTNIKSAGYDSNIFDYIAFDFGVTSTNGYDSFLYESTTFDFYTPTTVPKKLNRFYEFTVKVSDGDSSVNRTFKIYVVGDDYFKADTTGINNQNAGTFTSDASFVRAPIWTTPKNLGIKRASNYHIFKLDVYDDKNPNPIAYELDKINPRIQAIATPNNNQENRLGTNIIRIKKTSGAPLLSDKIYLKNYVEKYIIPDNGTDPIISIIADNTIYNITNIQTITSTEYVLTIYPSLTITIPTNTSIGIGTLSQLPPGMLFDVGNGEVFGVVPYQTSISQTYNFTAIAYRMEFQSDHIEIGRSRRTFTVTMLGTVDSVITWNSDSNLGQIAANLICNLFVNASTTIPNTSLIYSLKSGSLPPGISLNLNGELIGKVNQYGSVGNPGLVTFDDTETTFDNAETTFDKKYKFVITATDVINFDSVDKEFTLEVTTPNQELYSNLTVKPFLKLDQRTTLKSFLGNTEIFTPEYIYRPDDPNFGVQKELKMLIYAGIETKPANIIASMMLKNHRRKRLILGDIKTAKAQLTGTDTIVYEVIYVEVIDPLEPNKKVLPFNIKTSNTNLGITVDQNNSYNTGPFNQINPYWQPPNPLYAPADSDFIFAGDSYTAWKSPASISLWRKRIRTLGLRDRNYLPLWMRTVQDGSVVELDYQTAVPICYCLPGYSKDILLNIKNSGFNFKIVDYEIDRYIIDSVTGYSSDKYLVFKNDRNTIS